MNPGEGKGMDLVAWVLSHYDNNYDNKDSKVTWHLLMPEDKEKWKAMHMQLRTQRELESFQDHFEESLASYTGHCQGPTPRPDCKSCRVAMLDISMKVRTLMGKGKDPEILKQRRTLWSFPLMSSTCLLSVEKL